MSDLKKHRLDLEKADIKQKKDAKDQKMQSIKNVSFKDYYQPQEYVANPKYNATWQMRAEEKRTKRRNIGLLEESNEINGEKLPDPSVKWVDKPLVSSKTVLVDKRRQNILDDQGHWGSKFETHRDGQGRVEERENCIARITYKGDVTSWNKAALKAKRTREMIDDMTQKFGDQVLGVHGAELPKFAGHPEDQYYWKYQKSYNPKPKCQSLNQLKQNYKYWADDDKMLLADTTGEKGPDDCFKMGRIINRKSKFDGITAKVTMHDLLAKTNKIGEA